MVGVRLDYCNTVLYGKSKSNIQKLQRVQNSLARIVTGTRRSDRITPVLARLHWIKITDPIDYKNSVADIQGRHVTKGQTISSTLFGSTLWSDSYDLATD